MATEEEILEKARLSVGASLREMLLDLRDEIFKGRDEASIPRVRQTLAMVSLAFLFDRQNYYSHWAAWHDDQEANLKAGRRCFGGPPVPAKGVEP